MITAEQIKAAHGKVKSGTDFPSYIQDIKQLGVTHYEVAVANGNATYFGANNHQASTGEKYENLAVDDTSNPEQFKADLLAHQQGKTNYLSFCNDCAKSGIEKWTIDIAKMTCTYYDKAGNEILVENIPV